MSRWRDVKKGKVTSADSSAPEITSTCQNVSMWPRFKAFVVDMFMIYTPILYITAYGILGGGAEFRHNGMAQFIAVLIYGLVSAVTTSWMGQTPGKRAYEIKVVDSKSGKKISFFRAVLRFVLFLFSATILIGVLLPFWRKDKRTLHDLLMGTCVVAAPKEKSVSDSDPSHSAETK